jgi:hypothetical protein
MIMKTAAITPLIYFKGVLFPVKLALFFTMFGVKRFVNGG